MPIFALLVAMIWSPSIMAYTDNLKELEAQCKNGIGKSCGELGFRIDVGNHRYSFHQKGCDLNYIPSCSQVAARVDGAPVDPNLTLKYLEKRCSENDEICGDYANALRDLDQIKKSLDVERKFYLKYQSGVFPFHLYLSGEKKEAFYLILKKCQADTSTCDFYLRYTPDHPQLDQIISIVSTSCKESLGKSSGANSCMILGSYYYKYNNLALALEAFTKDCHAGKNPISCYATIAASPAPKEQVKAAIELCSIEERIRPVSQPTLTQEKCRTMKQKKIISAEIVLYAKTLLADFVKQQQ